MRRKLHALISSGWYSAGMVICIVVSIVPLAFRSEPAAFRVTEAICTAVFVFDYAARWITADLDDPSRYPFARYPFRPMAVIDLVSILPSMFGNFIIAYFAQNVNKFSFIFTHRKYPI